MTLAELTEKQKNHTPYLYSFKHRSLNNFQVIYLLTEIELKPRTEDGK